MNELLVHVDVDSPRKLLNFYNARGVSFSDQQLRRFYETSLARAAEFFLKNGIAATFFIVGDEACDPDVAASVRAVYNAGHEIENHTWSHPFGLVGLSDEIVRLEISRCGEEIEKITGHKPWGFRSPGYSVSTKIINELRQQGYRYDSSGFWSLLNPVIQIAQKLVYSSGVQSNGFGEVTHRLPARPYYPSEADWLKERKTAGLLELPLPRTRALRLPFYNNFNLWLPRQVADSAAKSVTTPNVIYLFHIVEFMDMSDGLPAELARHPNVRVPATKKIKRSSELISILKRRYQPSRTREFVTRFSDHNLN